MEVYTKNAELGIEQALSVPYSKDRTEEGTPDSIMARTGTIGNLQMRFSFTVLSSCLKFQCA
jgi:hypothetical protein